MFGRDGKKSLSMKGGFKRMLPRGLDLGRRVESISQVCELQRREKGAIVHMGPTDLSLT